MLESFAFRLSMDCRACRISMPVNGIVESVRCYHCGETSALGRFFFKDHLDRCFVEAEEMAPGAMKDESRTHLGAAVRLSYGRGAPHCPTCPTAPIEPALVIESVAKGGCFCGKCGKSVRVRPADALLSAVHPGARFAVSEHALDETAQALSAKTKPVMFQCMSCGGALHVDGNARVVACSYCKSDNYLPDGLWQMLHPVPKPEVFFLLCEIDGPEDRLARARQPNLPAPEYERLAQDRDLRVVQAVAANPHAPPTLLRWLCGNRHRSVLEGLAANPALPLDMVQAMAKSDDAEFRAIAATNPALSHELLRDLAHDPNPAVVSAAHARIEQLKAQGVNVEGFFARLFG
jgi:hypothetical protein